MNSMINTWKAVCDNPSESAFAPFYEGTRKLVWSICLRVLRDEDDARDAFQATYARLVHAARSRDREADTPYIQDFVARTAIRESDALRKRRARRSVRETQIIYADEPPEFSTDPAQSSLNKASRNQVGRRVESFVAELPEHYRTPIQMFDFHGLSYDAVAQALDIPINTISSRWLMEEVTLGSGRLGKISRVDYRL